MAKHIALFFDGTWNHYKDQTNVSRLHRVLQSSGERDPEQPCHYDRGVGTRWYTRLLGGAFGVGLSQNIQQSYYWLADVFEPGDKIYVFGFSRGAYTARSFVGLIRKCGVLQRADRERVLEAYGLYRDKSVHPDAVVAQQFRQRHAHETRVKFIGVWDTVGALGIPATGVPLGRDFFQWHDTELSKIVDFAYHAMAIDEHREDYDVTVWKKSKPENIDVEQRWFIGAHSNVGGGYASDSLPNAPLQWLQQKAANAVNPNDGTDRPLRFLQEVACAPQDCLAPVNDSFAEFMAGFYQRFKKRYHRAYGAGVNETVDESVWQRWRSDANYRPRTLATHPEKPG